jgi:hypothetical protein
MEPKYNDVNSYEDLPKSFYDDKRGYFLHAPKDVITIHPKRDEYKLQLDRAVTMRSIQKWDLVPFADWKKFQIDQHYWYALQKEQRPLRIHYTNPCPVLANMTEILMLQIMNSRFPCVQIIMKQFPGKIFPAGGFYTNPFITTDIDLFFVGCTKEEACEIMETFEQIFKEVHPNKEKSFKRNVGTTTFIKKHPDSYGISDSYQFIHRRYPTLSHVIGGFDLSCSMIAFDGKHVVANSLGAWAWVNRTIVIDISRRSLSFEHRLMKYYKRGFDLIFPGTFHYEVPIYSASLMENKADLFYEELAILKKKYNMVLSKSSYMMGSSGGAGQTIYIDNDYDAAITKSENDDRIYIPDSSIYIRGFKIGPHYNEKIQEVYTITINGNIKNNESDYTGTGNILKIITTRDNNISNVCIGNLNAVEIFLIYTSEDESFLTNLPEYLEEYAFDSFDRPKDNKYFGVSSSHRQNLLDKLIDLSEIKWFEQDPGRQWSSTVNPAIINAKEFYLYGWNGTVAYNIYNLLLSFKKYKAFNVFKGVVPDVIKMIASYTVSF